MYLGKLRLRGMGDVADDSYTPPLMSFDAPTPDQLAITNDYPVVSNDTSGNYYSNSSTPVATGSSTPWTDIFKAALGTYGAINVADTQAKTAQTAQQYQYAQQLAARGLSPTGQVLPRYTPLLGTSPSGSSISPALIVAMLALGGAALYFA